MKIKITEDINIDGTLSKMTLGQAEEIFRQGVKGRIVYRDWLASPGRVEFIVALHKDPGSDYGATVLNLPGCFSAGSTIKETLLNVLEAIECHIGESKMKLTGFTSSRMSTYDIPEPFLFALDFSNLKLRTYNRDWADPLGVSAWMNREAKYYTVEALNLVTYFLDGAIDALMWLMETTDELSNKLDKGS